MIRLLNYSSLVQFCQRGFRKNELFLRCFYILHNLARGVLVVLPIYERILE